jgi:hypothetical protein
MRKPRVFRAVASGTHPAGIIDQYGLSCYTEEVNRTFRKIGLSGFTSKRVRGFLGLDLIRQ